MAMRIKNLRKLFWASIKHSNDEYVDRRRTQRSTGFRSKKIKTYFLFALMSIFLKKKMIFTGFLRKQLDFLFCKNSYIFFVKPGKFFIEIL